MPKVSHWKRMKLKQKREREKRERRTDVKATARAKPSMITHRVPKASRKPIRQPAQLDAGLSWYGLRTNIKCEDKARRGLQSAGVGIYMPVEEIERVRRGKRVSKERPCLSRYMFVGLPKDDPPFGVVRDVDGVESLLGVGGEPQRVRVEALAKFDAALIAAEQAKAECLTSIAIGDEVKIKEGNLIGFNARVSKMTADTVRVDVSMFGRSTPVDLPLEAVSPL